MSKSVRFSGLTVQFYVHGHTHLMVSRNCFLSSIWFGMRLRMVLRFVAQRFNSWNDGSGRSNFNSARNIYFCFLPEFFLTYHSYLYLIWMYISVPNSLKFGWTYLNGNQALICQMNKFLHGLLHIGLKLVLKLCTLKSIIVDQFFYVEWHRILFCLFHLMMPISVSFCFKFSNCFQNIKKSFSENKKKINALYD